MCQQCGFNLSHSPLCCCLIRLLSAKGWDWVLPVLLRRQHRPSARSQHSFLLQKPSGAKHGEQPGRRPPGHHNTGITCKWQIWSKSQWEVRFIFFFLVNYWLCVLLNAGTSWPERPWEGSDAEEDGSDNERKRKLETGSAEYTARNHQHEGLPVWVITTPEWQWTHQLLQQRKRLNFGVWLSVIRFYRSRMKRARKKRSSWSKKWIKSRQREKTWEAPHSSSSKKWANPRFVVSWLVCEILSLFHRIRLEN